MTDTQNREYLDGVSTEIQDLLYEDRGNEAVELLMEQTGLGKMQAALEAARIASRMQEEFPDEAPDLATSGTEIGPPPELMSALKWIFFAFFGLAGIALTTFGTIGIVRASESTGWPSVQGKVIKSSVERESSTRSGSARTGGGSRRTSYHARVAYKYTVDGADFAGDRVAYGDHGGKRKHAQRIVNRYRKGKAVAVHYRPDDPSVCLLEPGLKAQTFLMPFMGLIALLIPGFIIWSMIAAARDKRKTAAGM